MYDAVCIQVFLISLENGHWPLPVCHDIDFDMIITMLRVLIRLCYMHLHSEEILMKAAVNIKMKTSEMEIQKHMQMK